MLADITDEKVVILGDVHLGARNDSLAFHRRFEKFFDYLFDYMAKNDLKTIIQVGDMFDRRKFISFQTLNIARKYLFDRLAGLGIKMVVLVGNHDTHLKSSLNGNAPRLLLSEYKANVTVVDEPTTIGLGHTSALLVPWICLDNQEACMAAIAKAAAPICLGHFELSGFEMYKNSVCLHGLSADLFWKFRHVYSGHFHHVSTKGNITYVGSPFQITWADFEDDRGFFVFDTATSSARFVKNPFENFFKLKYDDSTLKLADLEKLDFETYRDTFVKVIIVKRDNHYLLDKFVEGLEKVDANVQTVEDHKHKNVQTDADIVKNVDDIDQTLRKAADQFKDTVDAKRLHQFLIQLYNEASNQTG